MLREFVDWLAATICKLLSVGLRQMPRYSPDFSEPKEIHWILLNERICCQRNFSPRGWGSPNLKFNSVRSIASTLSWFTKWVFSRKSVSCSSTLFPVSAINFWASSSTALCPLRKERYPTIPTAATICTTKEVTRTSRRGIFVCCWAVLFANRGNGIGWWRIAP